MQYLSWKRSLKFCEQKSLINSAAQNNTKNSGKILKRRFSAWQPKLILFLDNAHFTLSRNISSQNNKWWSYKNPKQFMKFFTSPYNAVTVQKVKRSVLFGETNSDQYIQFILAPLFRSTHILGWTSLLIYKISWNCRRNMYHTSSQWQASYAIKMCKYEPRRYDPHSCHGSSIMLFNMSSDSRKYMKWR